MHARRSAPLLAAAVVGGLLLPLGAAEAVCQEQVVLRGIPASRVSSGPEGTQREVLGAGQGQEYSLLIVKRDGRYFWASREDCELAPGVSGIFVMFTALTCHGYIKVLDQRDTPDDSITRFDGSDIQYMEHVHSQFLTITYYGDAARFDP